MVAISHLAGVSLQDVHAYLLHHLKIVRRTNTWPEA
ncbi:hypothetical protein DFAR_2990012 [Desulfarculales bacterium]